MTDDATKMEKHAVHLSHMCMNLLEQVQREERDCYIVHYHN